jgi:hypothetical protein
MKIKFGMFDKLKVFKALVENQTKKKIKAIICVSWMLMPWNSFI